MIRIIVYILFFWGIVWSWNTIGERMISTDVIRTETTSCEAKAYINPMIYVLVEANRCADLSVRSINSSLTNFVRRYRLGEQCAGIFSVYFKNSLKSISNHLLNFSFELSQGCAALLREAGYYVYSLRKMII